MRQIVQAKYSVDPYYRTNPDFYVYTRGKQLKKTVRHLMRVLYRHPSKDRLRHYTWKSDK